MTAYVVVNYSHSHFHIYTKQHSDKSKMIAYYEEQCKKHPSCKTLLITKAKAEVMKQVWHNIHANYGRSMTRSNKIKSILGHDPENDGNYERHLRKWYGEEE